MLNLVQWGALQALEVKPAKARRLCVMLHGYGANAADLFSLHQMIFLGKNTHWIFPDGILDLGQAWSRAWFPIDVEALERALQLGTHRDFSSISSSEFESASDIVFESLSSSLGQYEEVILAGFSQGAMLATDLALRTPGVSRLIAFSSNLIDEKRTRRFSSERQNKFSFFQSHGIYDPLLSLSGAKKLFEILSEDHHQGSWHEFSGGHEIPQTIIQSLNEWIKA